MPDPRCVLGKAQIIVEAFTDATVELGLAELVQRTGLHKGTVYRVAGDLAEWGILERNNGTYRLGVRLFELGMRAPKQRLLRDSALPFLGDLYGEVHELVYLVMLQDAEALVLEKIGGHRRIRLKTPPQIGERVALHTAAAGKALLAFAPASLLEQLVIAGLERKTPYTISSPAVLIRQLQDVRRTGLAHEREEAHLGVCAMAVPVFAPRGQILGAVAITAKAPRSLPERFGQSLLRCGAAITRELESLERRDADERGLAPAM